MRWLGLASMDEHNPTGNSITALSIPFNLTESVEIVGMQVIFQINSIAGAMKEIPSAANRKLAPVSFTVASRTPALIYRYISAVSIAY